ncbi:MAG: hypothetical protein JO244_02560 [Solirubrobacterales bacterium]|nr:hypothetical protein [Solirubrobacterales bacterium]
MNRSARWGGLVARAWGVGLALGMIGLLAALTAGPAGAAANCQLGPGGQIRHVVILQFDNVHLTRDNPNVPSDIQQIPALDHFLKDQGSLLSNDHTVLISHTADGITSTETGLYPGDEGLGVANSFEYYVPYGSGTANNSAFTYWTDPVSSSDKNYEMIFGGPSATGSDNNTPAPWVPFTRAGCDFAGIGSANMEFENDTKDVSNVFGSGSPQAALGNWSYNTAYQKYDAGSNLGVTDFEGLAIHCSLADSAPGGRCANGKSDVLPSEPGGYLGYNALFGALAVNPVLTGQQDQPLSSSFLSGASGKGVSAPILTQGNWQAPPVYDVFAPNADNTGRHAAPDPGDVGATDSPPPDSYQPGKTPTTKILDWTLNPGFPGFDGMEANNALGYTAAAQEAGIPVTYTYMSDVHDDQYFVNGGNAFGPGEAGHEAQLREYNAAFEAFFHRLAHDGIGPWNTVFLVTVDEGDHFDGGQPLNPGCDGVSVPCQYGTGASRNVGEVDVNLPQLLQSEGNSTKFGFDFDDAPTILVPNQTDPTAAPPSQTSATVRGLEHTIASTSEYNPIVNKTVPITVALADQTEEQILHMVNADPRRTPTFTLFGDPSFYFQASCDGSGSAGCPTQNPGYAWNHGDIQPEIATTWQGWVGPGIRNLGQTDQVWTDHTDARPTLLTLLGLRDDYSDDGRAIAQIFSPGAAPWSIRVSRRAYDQLSGVYKQLTAPFGEFGTDTLAADSSGVESSSPGDSAYTGMDSQLQACASARDALAAQIEPVLEAAETGQRPVENWQAWSLGRQASELIRDVDGLASGPPPAGNVCS